MCSKFWGFFVRSRKGWIGFISGVLCYAMVISKVRNHMLFNGCWSSSAKSQIPHTSPSTTPWSKMPRIQKLHRKWKKIFVLHQKQPFAKISMNSKHKAMNLMIIILVALVLDMSRTFPGLVYTVQGLGQNTLFIGTQDSLQNVSHGSVTCPSCPATRLCQSRTKNNRASHGPKITVADQK